MGEHKARGDDAIRRWINAQLKGTSVTVVLIGHETYSRRYVRYEIERTWALGHGLLGIHIHRLKNFFGKTSLKGPNPFDDYEFKDGRGTLVQLSSVVRTYDWIGDDGYTYFGRWVEAAARQAGL